MKKNINVTFYKSVTCHHEEEERMPTLEEVFQQFPNIPINLDIKAENIELMEKVRQLYDFLTYIFCQKQSCYNVTKLATLNNHG